MFLCKMSIKQYWTAESVKMVLGMCMWFNDTQVVTHSNSKSTHRMQTSTRPNTPTIAYERNDKNSLKILDLELVLDNSQINQFYSVSVRPTYCENLIKIYSVVIFNLANQQK